MSMFGVILGVALGPTMLLHGAFLAKYLRVFCIERLNFGLDNSGVEIGESTIYHAAHRQATIA